MFASPDQPRLAGPFVARIDAESTSISPFARALLVGLAAVIMLGFAGARRLEPDPAGFGTHRQLGLAECSTRARSGRACPTCGMTTGVALMARGELSKAWRTQPAAASIAFMAIVTAIWSAVSAWRGKIIGFASGDTALAWWAGGSFVIALTCWAIRWQQWAEIRLR